MFIISIIEQNGKKTEIHLTKLAEYFGMKKFVIDWITEADDPVCPFMIKKIDGVVGYALFAAKPFKAGSYILRFLGEPLCLEESTSDDYAADAGDGTARNGKFFVISTKNTGGLSRFVSHAYNAQLTAGATTANLFLVNLSMSNMRYITLRDIAAGEILTCDLGVLYWELRKNRFPNGPTPFSKTGECLPLVKQTPSQFKYFTLRNLLHKEMAMNSLKPFGVIFSENVECIGKKLSAIFSEFEWATAKTGNKDCLLVFAGTDNIEHSKQLLEPLKASLGENINTQWVINSSGKTEKLMLVIVDITHAKYLMILKKLIVNHSEHQKSIALLSFEVYRKVSKSKSSSCISPREKTDNAIPKEETNYGEHPKPISLPTQEIDCKVKKAEAYTHHVAPGSDSPVFSYKKTNHLITIEHDGQFQLRNNKL